MKLLKEYYTLTPGEETLLEYKKCAEEGKPMVLQGIIQRADTKNQNGRVYPKDILQKECDRYLEETVKKNLALGELDHTDSPIIELKNVSHILEDIWWENNDVLGRIKLLNTPKGKIAQELVLSGIPIGISSRAVGSVSQNESEGVDLVQDDLNLICWDLVGQPSTSHAFLSLHEVKNFDKRKILPPKLRIKQILDELNKK